MPGIITQGYMEALGKQIFAKDFILNGLFPCQSSIVKMINLAKVDWKFNDKFEYRMLMANTNSGGTINTQTFDSNFRITHPGNLEYGIFQATYGALMDGFIIDMMKQLETRESKAAFNKEYAMRLHSMRINVASLFKNFVINGRYGVAHRIMPPMSTKQAGGGGAADCKYKILYGKPADYPGEPGKKQAYIETAGWRVCGYSEAGAPGGGGTWAFPESLKRGDHIRIETPRNVFNTNFKNGRLLSRAGPEAKINPGESEPSSSWYQDTEYARYAPWGKSMVGEMYVVFDNQARYLELVYIGKSGEVAGWHVGEFLEVAGNRKVKKAGGKGYQDCHVVVDTTAPAAYTQSDDYVDGNPASTAYWKWCFKDGSEIDIADGPDTLYYTEQTGATEGLADLFPWYTCVGAPATTSQQMLRLGLDRAFRGQKNRLRYTVEQAGTFIQQEKDQSIMDAVMMAVDLAQSVCDWEDLVVWINPTTLAAIGAYEQFVGGNMGGLQVFKEAQIDSKLIYQRGITGISYKIGEKVIPNVVKDYNLPTDIILLAPLKDISYNCWDNAAFELTQYIQDTWSGKKPPAPKELSVPKEFATKLDLSSRIVYGTPVAADLALQGLGSDYNGFVHPSNSIPVAYQEMGTLFTTQPYAYTVVKLLNQIISPNDVTYQGWSDFGAGCAW